MPDEGGLTHDDVLSDATEGDTMPSYSDVHKAVRVEKFRIWLAWASGGAIWLIITNATRNVPILSVITQVLLVALGIFFTVAALTMTRKLNAKADAARKEVLGEL
ncbi:hypothetical protein ACFXJ5_10895 [Streptomyces sp. NPDC059373]